MSKIAFSVVWSSFTFIARGADWNALPVILISATRNFESFRLFVRLVPQADQKREDNERDLQVPRENPRIHAIRTRSSTERSLAALGATFR